ncbi:GNAT family N-acetyltransferase [Nitrospirillum amazonense]|nr:GNAT family N-acetyltransferase [Nitrospirillum amazonense]
MTSMAGTVIRMRRSLDGPLPAPAWPEGVRLTSFSPMDAPEAHALFTIGYANGGGGVGGLDDWWTDLSTDGEYDPTLLFLVRDSEDRLVGAAQCWTSAFVKDLVVHPLWRRRGIGLALLFHVFASFRERGATAVELKVLRDNPRALGLYGRAGMTVRD